MRAPRRLTARAPARWPRLLTLGASLPAAAALGWAAARRGRGASRRTGAGRPGASRPAGVGRPGSAEALALLGARQPEVRVGAIYALERAAIRSAEEHPVVMSVLAAFVREHSHPAQPDVQAALTVIGRRASDRDQEPIDLTGADLALADLTGADLAGANLTAADLTGARLAGAYLVGATLTRATLANADLTGALFLHKDAQAAGWTGPVS